MDEKTALALGLAEQVHALKFKLVQKEREIEGLQKANALLNKGMESQAELMDELKQETRRQKNEVEERVAAERAACAEMAFAFAFMPKITVDASDMAVDIADAIRARK